MTQEWDSPCLYVWYAITHTLWLTTRSCLWPQLQQHVNCSWLQTEPSLARVLGGMLCLCTWPCGDTPFLGLLLHSGYNEKFGSALGDFIDGDNSLVMTVPISLFDKDNLPNSYSVEKPLVVHCCIMCMYLNSCALPSWRCALAPCQTPETLVCNPIIEVTFSAEQRRPFLPSGNTSLQQLLK